MRQAFIIAALTGVFFGAGCVSSSALEENLVERSRLRVPTWIDLEPGIFHESDETLRFVVRRQGIVDVPLGLKQAELGALSDMSNALHAMTRREIREFMSQNQNTVDPILLDKILMEGVRFHLGKYGRLRDIYYEAVEKRIPGMTGHEKSTRIYVLMSLPRDKMSRLLSDLQARFEKAGRPDLEGLALSLKKYTEQFGH